MLLIGPPGSGKTHYVLEKLTAALRERREDRLALVVPTASMARHLTHELARRGLTVPGKLIMPIARLVERLIPDLEEPSAAVDAWLIAAAIEQGGGATFAPLAGKAGFEKRVAETLRELEAARCRPDDFDKFARGRAQLALAQVYRLVPAVSRHPRAGFGPPSASSAPPRKRRSKVSTASKRSFFDGFFSFSVGERDLIHSLATAGRRAHRDRRPGAARRLPSRLASAKSRQGLARARSTAGRRRRGTRTRSGGDGPRHRGIPARERANPCIRSALCCGRPRPTPR